MQGNFEYDPGSYPFTAVRIGDEYIVHFLPEMQALHRTKLPAELAAAVALRVNTQYRAARAGGVKFAVKIADMLDLISFELPGASLPGATVMHIQTNLENEREALAAMVKG